MQLPARCVVLELDDGTTVVIGIGIGTAMPGRFVAGELSNPASGSLKSIRSIEEEGSVCRPNEARVSSFTPTRPEVDRESEHIRRVGQWTELQWFPTLWWVSGGWGNTASPHAPTAHVDLPTRPAHPILALPG